MYETTTTNFQNILLKCERYLHPPDTPHRYNVFYAFGMAQCLAESPAVPATPPCEIASEWKTRLFHYITQIRKQATDLFSLSTIAPARFFMASWLNLSQEARTIITFYLPDKATAASIRENDSITIYLAFDAVIAYIDIYDPLPRVQSTETDYFLLSILSHSCGYGGFVIYSATDMFKISCAPCKFNNIFTYTVPERRPDIAFFHCPSRYRDNGNPNDWFYIPPEFLRLHNPRDTMFQRRPLIKHDHNNHDPQSDTEDDDPGTL
jgi:hypothetical protein